jgi:DNA-binding NarL/FixJ family response regulator
VNTRATSSVQSRIVLCDDHPIWRRGVREDLGDGFWVVAEAGSAPDAIEAIRRTRPDIVLCDVHMPEGGGLRVVRECGELAPIVMLSVSSAERDVLDAVASGARGYLTKDTTAAELRRYLTDALAGIPVFSPELAVLVLAEFRRLARGAGGSAEPAGALTGREREVLGLVARGLPYREVGERLTISARTVENHVRNILDKLHLTRRDELIRYAAQRGIE